MDEPKDDLVPRVMEGELPDWPGESLPDDALDERDLAAIAQLDAGQFISNEAMIRWLESWFTEDELPPPECGM